MLGYVRFCRLPLPIRMYDAGPMLSNSFYEHDLSRALDGRELISRESSRIVHMILAHSTSRRFVFFPSD